MVDRERRPRVGRAEAHRAARARLHREHRDADLVTRPARAPATGSRRRPTAPARSALLATRDRHLRHEQRPRALVRGRLVAQPLRALEAEADADVVDQPLPDRQLRADAAAQQDPRRAVGARRQHHRVGAQLAGRRREPDRAIALDQHAVDERVREDRQVAARARRVEVREGRVPAHRADRVDGVQDRAVAGRVGERGVPGRELLARDLPHADRALRAAQVRLDRLVAPAVPPLVVVRGRAGDQDAGVVRRAAADDAGAQLRAVLAVGLPRVRERERACVEHVRRPASTVVGAVVRPRLDEPDAPPVLAQPRREHAAGGAAARDQHVEARARGHRATLAQAGTPVASARVIRTDDSIFEPAPPRKTPLTGGMSS